MIHFCGSMKFLNMNIAVNYHVLIIQDIITSTGILIDELLQHV